MTDVWLGDPVAYWARVTPDKEAFVEPASGRRWSYAAMDREVSRWTGWLASRGIGSGSRVALLMRNRAEVVFLLLACGRRGALVAPLNWRLAGPELADIVSRFSPVLLIAEASFADGFAEPPPGWCELESEAIPAAEATSAWPARVPVRPDDGWIVLFTSGTTGTPKGAILPHRQMFANALATGLGWRLGADEIVPITVPFFHTGGLNVLSIPVWQRGGSVVLLDRFDPEEFLDVLAREQCSIGFGVPAQYVMLVERPEWSRRLPHLRLWLSGGSACPPPLARRIAEPGYRFLEGFGLTEFGPNCFTGSSAALDGESGVVGLPMPGVEPRLVDEDGREVAPGETGELWLRGPMSFTGYLDDPERTAETLVDGWVRTGDLFACDDRGRYAVRGRKKEMFISGGENVYPAEVEATLAAHPAIAEVAVVGVGDPRWGEVGRAFVACRAPGVEADDLLHWVRARLAGYKVPREVVYLAQLPRLHSGKLDRAALRQWPAP